MGLKVSQDMTILDSLLELGLKITQAITILDSVLPRSLGYILKPYAQMNLTSTITFRDFVHDNL